MHGEFIYVYIYINLVKIIIEKLSNKLSMTKLFKKLDIKFCQIKKCKYLITFYYKLYYGISAYYIFYFKINISIGKKNWKTINIMYDSCNCIFALTFIFVIFCVC